MRSRSAHSLPLVRYSAFIAWGGGVRRFPQLILSWSHHGKVAAMMVWRLCVSSIGPSCGPCSRLVSPSRVFLIHPCCSKQEAAAFSIYLGSSSCHRAPSRQILRPLPIPSRPSSRFASRRPSRSHAVSLCFSVLISFLSCPMCRALAVRLFAAPFCSAYLAVLVAL